MKLSLQTLHTNQIKCHGNIQITLEEDINVPDTKPDIDTIIKHHGTLEISEIKSEQDKVILRGNLPFTLLYSSNDDIRPIHNMQSQIPFEESINIESLTPSDEVFCHYELEDCQIQLINSRKISIRAIVSFHCQAEEISSNAAGVDIVSDEAARAGMESSISPEGLHKRYEIIQYTQTSSRQKDLFRIKDEFSLPKGKSTIDTILYYEMTPQNLQTRLMEDGIRVTGDLLLFLLYVPEEEERRMEYIETELPIDGMVNCVGCHENFIPDISFQPQNGILEVKTDEDGNQRILEIELPLAMNIKFYEDKDMEILNDAYSTACEISLSRQDISFEKLLLKTQNVLRFSQQLKPENPSDKILQVCTSTGKVQIDEQEIQENGIAIEGIMELDILYIADNDERPLGNIKGIIPFQHFIEVKNISPKDYYQLQSDISQISILMLDSEELEAKVVMNLGAMVFTPQSQSVIAELEEGPLDLERLQKMPGIVGFIADEKTTLWNLAKEYATSPESIMELNGLATEQIQPGDRLLLAKQVDCL